MRVTIRLFARLRDLGGAAELSCDLPEGARAGDVWRWLLDRHPDMQPYSSSVSVAVNADFARMASPLRDGDEVAFLPPVSGGTCRCSSSDVRRRA